jgi:hypothetical protein
MKTIPFHTPLKALAWICLCLCTESVYAGQTVLSTTDSAPTYDGHGGKANEVVTAADKDIIVTTTWTNGTVTLGTPSYVLTPSGGLVMMDTYPSVNATSEVAMFSVASAGIGQVNHISLTITHSGSGYNTTCTTNDTQDFYACVPKITAARAPGDTTKNTFETSDFKDIVTISGCDDFSQIEWVQMLTDNENYSDYSGTAHNVYNYGSGTIDWPTSNSGWGSPGGTTGWTFTISGYNATLSPSDNHPDTSAVSATGTFQIGGTGQTYYYTELSDIELLC